MGVKLQRALLALAESDHASRLTPRGAFHYAALLGEVIVAKASVEQHPEGVSAAEVASFLAEGNEAFHDADFLAALETGIAALVQAHRKKWNDAEFFAEAYAFAELDMFLTGRDRLEYVNTAAKHYGEPATVRTAIDAYDDVDKVIRSHIASLLKVFEDDFRARPPRRCYPASFWWRPKWARSSDKPGT
jgi:hypothetical protein